MVQNLAPSGTLKHSESGPQGHKLRLDVGWNMVCKSCLAEKLIEFTAEINIQLPGFSNLAKPTVWAFPKHMVCMHCGFTEFMLPEKELSQLARGCECPESSTIAGPNRLEVVSRINNEGNGPSGKTSGMVAGRLFLNSGVCCD